MGRIKMDLPVDEIVRLYVEERMSSVQIGEIYGCAKSTILRKLRLSEVAMRPSGGQPNYITILNEFGFILDGLMLGDGGLHRDKRAGIGICYQHGSKYREYLVWLSSFLSTYGLRQCGKINGYEYTDKRTGSEYIGYHYRTVVYRDDLLSYYRRWYPSDKKQLPSDIQLYPSTILRWYIGDGTSNNGYPFLCRTTPRGEQEFLLGLLRVHGIDGTVCNNKRGKYGVNGIYIKAESRSRFFDYMLSESTEVPECYHYKFPLEYRERLT